MSAVLANCGSATTWPEAVVLGIFFASLLVAMVGVFWVCLRG